MLAPRIVAYLMTNGAGVCENEQFRKDGFVKMAYFLPQSRAYPRDWVLW